jgi:meiotically up-regulated gene 157 (Mug157) protein
LTSNLHDILFDDKITANQETLITSNHSKYGFIYSYEIDGLGNRNLMDDSNIPSLLSLPYLCPDDIPINQSIYQNTRKFVLSLDNPWFFKGSVLEGKRSHLTIMVYSLFFQKVMVDHMLDLQWRGHLRLPCVV